MEIKDLSFYDLAILLSYQADQLKNGAWKEDIPPIFRKMRSLMSQMESKLEEDKEVIIKK